MTSILFIFLLLVPAVAFWSAMFNAYMIHKNGGYAFDYLKRLAKFAFEYKKPG